MVKDFLGKELKVGDEVVRAGKSGKSPWLNIGTVEDFRIHTTNKNQEVAVLTEGNSKVGWTFPERLIKI